MNYTYDYNSVLGMPIHGVAGAPIAPGTYITHIIEIKIEILVRE